MVYILNVSDEALIQFNGSDSLNRDKDYAQRICKRISLNDNVPDIFEIDQEEAFNDNTVALQIFWKALELENYTNEERKKIILKNDTQNLKSVLEANKNEVDIEKAIYVYRPSWSSLRKINEGHEQILFQEKFKDSFYFF
ncbi:hypothetical protein PIROE2DRAFT_61517 [Piromyces sp. E2]|nr:hypothetical protein PIROE2DRAFT_61517 [Piromyces sp. E2]|eukprot:OUM63048.1 hypothetical protein PIROE2DRAFT_61517 [Piromyces sp. E2]